LASPEYESISKEENGALKLKVLTHIQV